MLCRVPVAPVCKPVQRAPTARANLAVKCVASHHQQSAAKVAGAAAAALLLVGTPAIASIVPTATPTYEVAVSAESIQADASDALGSVKSNVEDAASSAKRTLKNKAGKGRVIKERLERTTTAPQARAAKPGILIAAGGLTFLAYVAGNPDSRKSALDTGAAVRAAKSASNKAKSVTNRVAQSANKAADKAKGTTMSGRKTIGGKK